MSGLKPQRQSTQLYLLLSAVSKPGVTHTQVLLTAGGKAACSPLGRKLDEFSSVPSSWRHCKFLPNQTLNREVAGQKKEEKKKKEKKEVREREKMPSLKASSSVSIKQQVAI